MEAFVDIEVSIGTGKKVEAKVGNHIVLADQPKGDGGEDSAASPFEYFLASLALCAAYYVRSFCDSRNISTEGIRVIQRDKRSEGDNKYKRKIEIEIELTKNFPEKYKSAVIASAEQCTVKKLIQATPEFEVKIKQ